jgi:hypothetical protein
MTTRLRGATFLFAGALLLPVPATAASGAVRPDRRTYGDQDLTLVRIGAAEFTLLDSKFQSYQDTSNFGEGPFRRYAADTTAEFLAIGHVPSGALLDYFELDACDTNDGEFTPTDPIDVFARFYDCDFTGDDCHLLASVKSSDGSGGNTGCGYTIQNGIGHTVNNDRELVVYVRDTFPDTTNSFSGIYLGYRLQMSSAPGTATFADVPKSYLYFRAIEALAAAGITSGCGGGNFCPNQAVTRGEMARFLAVALGLHWRD